MAANKVLRTLTLLSVLSAQAATASIVTIPIHQRTSQTLSSRRMGPIYVPISLVANPSIVPAGGNASFTLTLNDLAFTNQAVTIATNHPEAFVNLPSQVVVPAGSQSVTFTVTTSSGSQKLSLSVGASENGAQVTTGLCVASPSQS